MLASGMPVPEASVNHDDGAVAREHDVGATGQILAVQAESEPEPVSNSTNGEFWLGVSTPDP